MIAIVVAFGSPNLQAELDTFCATFNIPSTPVEVYYPQGQPGSDSGWATETTIDVQWAHAIAPGARIVVVAAKSAFSVDLFSAVDFAVGLGAKQVSMSWGGAEFPSEANSDFHFNQAGVTFVASSGDSGAGVSYPASSPYVVGVGGTSLSLDASANPITETAWSGSGGGFSIYEAIPSYQAGWLTGTQRGVPDVAYDADPTTGVPVFQTDVGWSQYGGTSISAPQWSALFALVNSLRSQSISSAPNALYSLANESYVSYFRDVTAGSNGNPAGVGYDLVTGLGVPLTNQLVLALANGLSSQVAAPVFWPPAGTYAGPQSVTLASATPGTFISYTLDGTVPDSSSNGAIYSAPLSISSNTTLRAVAYRPGLSDSSVTSGDYAFLPSAGMPTFSPSSGTYTAIQTVTIASTTPQATIRYTVDGSTPTETYGSIYSGPVSVSSTSTIKAIAYAPGFIRSQSNSATYTIHLTPVAAPVFAPSAGVYASEQDITMSSTTPGVTIRYTTDGSSPSHTNGAIYAGPVHISQSTRLQAIAYALGYLDSSITSADYTINLPPAVQPQFSLATGSYGGPQTVAITSGSLGVTIIYTTDGSLPKEINGVVTCGTVYTTPVTISRSSVLKAIAFGGNLSDSPTTSGIYTITDSPSAILNALYNFESANGGAPYPQGVLALGSDGNFYGTTNSGGDNQAGSIFRVTPAGDFTALVSFDGINGRAPAAGLVLGSDGNFYGTTSGGGISNAGTIFRVNPSGVLTTLVSFYGGNGSAPAAGLIQGSDGAFYGTTAGGGSSGAGTVFMVTATGSLTTLVSFNGANGSMPAASLVQGSDGDFYGTTYRGGASNQGTVFKTTVTGVLSTLFSFSGDANGSQPGAALVEGQDGNFYGTTSNGLTRWGTIFRVTPSGQLTTLVTFDLVTNGGRPQGLLLAGDGYFYGTTQTGVGSGKGTVFRMSASGTLTTLVSFDGANGNGPLGVVQGSDGDFYGTTVSGLKTGVGTFFKLVHPPPAAAAPRFSPDSGSYAAIQSVVIATDTNGAAIRYTLDGSVPSRTNGILYDGTPVTIDVTTTLRAIAYLAGYSDSPISSATYSISLPIAASPTFSPGGGSYTSPQSVTLATETIGATIRYTTDGSTPSKTNGNTYSGAPVVLSSTATLRAIAFKVGYSDSPISSATYSITLPTVATPTFSPVGGTYSSPQSVVISSATAGATIRYTLDGSVPSATTGTVYTEPISIGSTTTLRAIAYKAGFTDSSIASASYSIVLQVAGPTFSPSGGSYTSVQSVSIVSATIGATIRYTTDGSLPSGTTGIVYGGPVMVSDTTTLRAIAYKSGYTDSLVTTAVFTVKAPPLVTTQPVSQRVAQGASCTFTVAASGSSPLSYQWRFNGKNISKATASAYTVQSAQASNTGGYSVVVTNPLGSVTSATASLTVNVPPTITSQPASQTVKRGSNVTFSVTATGTSPFSYQWYFNGAAISGATSAAYSINSVQPVNAGSYSVLVTNLVGSVSSSSARLTVK